MAGPFFFAWCGGAIQEQTLLATSGNTHGGVVETFTVVGDAAGSLVLNLANTTGFEVDQFYRIDGPGGSGYFIYDTSVLAGPPGSLAINGNVGSGTSVTFLITKAVMAGEVIGSLVAGSNVIVFDGLVDIPAGYYGVQGPGIAQTFYTQSFSGTSSGSFTTTFVTGSAFVYYDGSSGSAQMQYVVANINTHTGQDSVGNPTSSVSYNVAAQAATATSSGQYPVILSGMPDTDWYSITSLPAGDVASLQAGLRYNITGNGIQIGSTFVAPGGGTSIEIDQPASASQVGAILTITGPRTPDSAFDPSIHDRFDCDVLDIDISQEEGGFATLTIHLRASGSAIGLLGVGRNLWCWLSWDQNWTPAGGAPMSLVPLFNGRLVGVPTLQAQEIVQLEFLARPDDFNAQKQALATALSVLPYYDPVWLASNVSLDTVLETYSALWHIDRVSLGLSTSDVLQGEGGTVEIDESNSIYERFSLSYGDPPLVAVTLSGTVTWPQEADGYVDVTGKIVSAFGSQGNPVGGEFPKPYGATGPGGGGLISCLCGDGLMSSWPSPGTDIGGGWTLSSLNDGAGYPLCYIWNVVRPNGWLAPINYQVAISAQNPAAATSTNAGLLMNPYQNYIYDFPLNIYKVRMVLRYEANRKRTETVSAVMAADVQTLLSDSSESDRESVELTSEYVGQGVDAGGQVPIGDLSYRSYFQTDRGTLSFEYLLLAARAKLRARARAVDITFAVQWRTALGITLRNSVVLFDRRLPGGAATGKVKSYKLSVADGQMSGEFTIGCSIGNGDAATAATGVNAYVDDGYADPGYQVIAGGQSMLLDDELAYETLDDFVIDDDGLNLKGLSSNTAVNFCIVQNGMTKQLQELNKLQNTVYPSTFGDPAQVIATFYTQATLDMKPVAGSEFSTGFFPAVSPLALPKTIDLSGTDAGGALLRDLIAGGSGSRWDYGRGTSKWDGGSTVWDQPNG